MTCARRLFIGGHLDGQTLGCGPVEFTTVIDKDGKVSHPIYELEVWAFADGDIIDCMALRREEGADE